jgi:hypothetical protein
MQQMKKSLNAVPIFFTLKERDRQRHLKMDGCDKTSFMRGGGQIQILADGHG